MLSTYFSFKKGRIFFEKTSQAFIKNIGWFFENFYQQAEKGLKRAYLLNSVMAFALADLFYFFFIWRFNLKM